MGACVETADVAAALDVEDLPDALLEAIFQHLDAPTLLLSVAPASRRFRGASASLALWLPRLPPALAAVLRAQAVAYRAGGGSTGRDAARPLHLPTLYCALACTNLLRNPWLCLEEQLAARRSGGGDAHGRGKPPWLAVGGGHRWSWGPAAEEGLRRGPGVPLLPPPPLPPYQQRRVAHGQPPGVVAPSWGMQHSWPSLVQEVDLVGALEERGLSRQAACAFLDASPPLVLEVCTASRWDCEGWTDVTLAVDGRAGQVPLEYNELQGWLGGALGAAKTGRRDADSTRWRRCCLRLAGYRSGARRAVVVLAGSEHRFWAGFYGGKFAAPVLRFEMEAAPSGVGQGYGTDDE